MKYSLLLIAGATLVAVLSIASVATATAAGPCCPPAAHAHTPADQASAAALVAAQPAAAVPVVVHAGTQTHCPIAGGEIDGTVFEDHQGQRVYFCCPGCEGPYLQDVEKSLRAIGAKGQTVASIQTTCPVSGKPIDTDVYVDHAGRRIFFHCPACLPEFKQDPDGFAKNLR